jgi:hypothetical protein
VNNSLPSHDANDINSLSMCFVRGCKESLWNMLETPLYINILINARLSAEQLAVTSFNFGGQLICNEHSIAIDPRLLSNHNPATQLASKQSQSSNTACF